MTKAGKDQLVPLLGPGAIKCDRVEMWVQAQIGGRPLHRGDRTGLRAQGALQRRSADIERLHRIHEDLRKPPEQLTVPREPRSPREREGQHPLTKPKASAEAAAAPNQITATDPAERIKCGDDVQIIDVREPHEFEIARIPDGRLIPLRQVVSRAAEIDPSRTTVVHCKAGIRSAQAIKALQESGFTGTLINLQGGILAWSNDVDPSVPKY